MFVDSYIASLVVSILCSLDDHTKLYILLMKKKRILSRFSLKYWQWVKVVFHASTSPCTNISVKVYLRGLNVLATCMTFIQIFIGLLMSCGDLL